MLNLCPKLKINVHFQSQGGYKAETVSSECEKFSRTSCKFTITIKPANKLGECKPQAQEIDILEVIEGDEDSPSEDLMDL